MATDTKGNAVRVTGLCQVNRETVKVKRVFAFDPDECRALVLFSDPHYGERLAEVGPGDLWAVGVGDDGRERFGMNEPDILAQLRKMSEYTPRKP